jgi:hypothetical protein
MLLLSPHRSSALPSRISTSFDDLPAVRGPRIFDAFAPAERAAEERGAIVRLDDECPAADRRAEEDAERWDGLG